MRGAGSVLRGALVALILAFAPGVASAQLASDGLEPLAGLPQGSAILTLDQDRVFAESLFGKALQARTSEATKALAAENLTIETRLEEEERDLTARRSLLPPEEFAALAEAFDTKVEGIRQAQEAKNRDIAETAEADRQRFLSAVFPVLGELMSDAGAVAILPKSTVFMSLNAIDVTDEAIRRVDLVLGDGTTPPASPGNAQDAPSEPAAPEPAPAAP
jgi:Skp family chaperone for outer membrane proteins